MRSQILKIFKPHYSGDLRLINEELFMRTDYTDLFVVNESIVPLIEKNKFKWNTINIYPKSLRMLDNVGFDANGRAIFECKNEYLFHGPY